MNLAQGQVCLPVMLYRNPLCCAALRLPHSRACCVRSFNTLHSL